MTCNITKKDEVNPKELLIIPACTRFACILNTEYPQYHFIKLESATNSRVIILDGICVKLVTSYDVKNGKVLSIVIGLNPGD